VISTRSSTAPAEHVKPAPVVELVEAAKTARIALQSSKTAPNVLFRMRAAVSETPLDTDTLSHRRRNRSVFDKLHHRTGRDHVFSTSSPRRRGGERVETGYSPEYACRPLKKTFTTPKLKRTAENPMIASHADREPRHPRVARAWMYPA
jgi:hypothetical protein